MSTAPKEIVKRFYESDFIKEENLLEQFFHPEFSLVWNNSDGISVLNYEDMRGFFQEIRRTYSDLQIEISHLLPSDNQVTIRYYAKRYLEDQEEDINIAHFIAIFEIKEGKIFKGFQISQPISTTDEIKDFYTPVKI